MTSKQNPSQGQASTSTSRSLLKQAQANENDAWDRLILLYGPLVWHWCRKMSLPLQESADVFQEVFQAVAAHLPDFQRDRPGDTFRGWLRVITKNKVLDHFRMKQKEPQAAGGTQAKAWWSGIADSTGEISEELEDPGADHPLFHRALELIRDCFEEATWRAFWATVVEGRSTVDVANELSLSSGAVRVAKCRVLQRLRQELGDLPMPAPQEWEG